MARPPHRTWERESVMFEGCHPATVELLEYYEDSPSGRTHLCPEDPPTRPGLGFDTPEDRNRARELLLRIEDLDHEGKLEKMREFADHPPIDRELSFDMYTYAVACLRELLDTMDTIRSE